MWVSLQVAALLRGRPELSDKTDPEIEAVSTLHNDIPVDHDLHKCSICAQALTFLSCCASEQVVFAADLSSTSIDSAVSPPAWFARHLPRIWLGCWPTTGGDSEGSIADGGVQTVKPHLRGGTGHVGAGTGAEVVRAFLQAWENAAASVRETQEASTCRDVFTQSVQRLSADLAAQTGICKLLASSAVEVAWVDTGLAVWVPGAKILSLTGSASATGT
jgi:hypothetical protein